MTINDSPESGLDIVWKNGKEYAQLMANLKTLTFTINYTLDGIAKNMVF